MNIKKKKWKKTKQITLRRARDVNTQCVQIADRTCPEVLVIVKIVILVMHIQQNVNIINTDDGKFNKTTKCRTP
jgi:hypothetical protein